MKMDKRLFNKAVIITILIASFGIFYLPLPGRATCRTNYKNYSATVLSAEDIAIYQALEKEEYKEEIASYNLSVLGFTLGKSTFKNVQDKLGTAEYYRNKIDGESADGEIYYISTAKGDDTVIEFSSGPSGGWEQLDGFIITTSQNLTKEINPTPSVIVNRKTSTKSGLRLGLSPKDFERIIGRKPSFKKRDALYYSFHKKEMEGKDLYDINSLVVAKFKDGKLIFLMITKTKFS